MTTRLLSAVAAAAVFSTAFAQSASSTVVSIPSPTVTLPASQIIDQGCWSTPLPLEDHGSYNFQSPGNCQLICLELGKPVMGLSDGTNCWCGDLIPPLSAKTDNASCDTSCSGTNKVMCGGAAKYWISLTGQTRNQVPNFSFSSSSASSQITSAPLAVQSSKAPDTVVIVQTNAATQSAQASSGGPNKVGIAVGVVVGVLALAGIIAGAVLYLRHKKRRDVEDQYRRNAAVNGFVNGGKLHTSHSSMTDSRLDPEFMARRSSNGSIADNEDYSRRILKVTNA